MPFGTLTPNRWLRSKHIIQPSMTPLRRRRLIQLSLLASADYFGLPHPIHFPRSEPASGPSGRKGVLRNDCAALPPQLLLRPYRRQPAFVNDPEPVRISSSSTHWFFATTPSFPPGLFPSKHPSPPVHDGDPVQHRLIYDKDLPM